MGENGQPDVRQRGEMAGRQQATFNGVVIGEMRGASKRAVSWLIGELWLNKKNHASRG